MKKNHQTWIWLGAGVLFIGCLYLFSGILMPFLTGLLVAYAMNPAVSRFEKWGFSRTLSTTFMIFSFFLLIGLLLFIAIPFIQAELLYLASRIPQYGDRILTAVKPLIDEVSHYIEPTDIEKLRSLASSYLVDVVTWGVKFLTKVLTSSLALANLISLIVITPITAFYFLRDWKKIIEAIDNWLPRPYEPTVKKLFIEINSTIGSFARGQALVCISLALYYSVMLTIIGLDFSIVVGLVIGVMAFIPYVGAIIGLLLSMGIAFAQYTEWSSIGLVGVIFVVGQTIEAYIFVPYLVGDRIGLHPVWVLFALLAGGFLYGFVGILFALPIAAAIGVLVRHGLEFYLKSPYYLGQRSSSKKPSREATRPSS